MTTRVSEKARKILHEVGLTQYETRAYLALLESGILTAGEISEKSNVPYSKIYEILNSLDQKGWIQAQQGRPRQYFPKPPSEALDATRLRFQNTLSRWEKVVLSELQPMYVQREFREKPDIWILRGLFSVLAKLQEMLSAVQKEVMIAAPAFAESYVDSSFSVLRKLRESDIQVQIMVTTDWNLAGVIHLGEIRIRDELFGGGVIVDGQEALLLLGEDIPTLVIWSNHKGLVRFAREYFQYLWSSSKPRPLPS